MNSLLHFPPIATFVCYFIASIEYFLALSARREKALVKGRFFLIAGLVFHLIFLIEIFSQRQEFQLGLPITLSILSLLISVSSLIVDFRLRSKSLGLFFAPLTTIFSLLSAIFFHLAREVNSIQHVGVLLVAHIILVIGAHALLVVAFGTSLAVIIEEFLLKKKKFTKLLQTIPSLNYLDNLCSKLLTSGFALMVLGIVVGFVFASTNGISFFTFDARLVWSFITLFVYAMLLLARGVWGWRGTRAAWLAVFGFLTVLASFYGVNLGNNSFHIY
jgi:ABC-type uncharacterized transport system permease subunit